MSDITKERIEVEAVKRAQRDPMPGPVADAFAVLSDIEVGPFKVRPIYDIDFMFLKQLSHPLHEYMLSQDKQDITISMRGETCWELCYIFTHSVDDVESMLKKGVDIFRQACADEFGKKYQMNALLEINKAIFEQFRLYWEPVLQFSSQEANGKSTETFFRDTDPQTHSGGG